MYTGLRCCIGMREEIRKSRMERYPDGKSEGFLYLYNICQKAMVWEAAIGIRLGGDA